MAIIRAGGYICESNRAGLQSADLHRPDFFTGTHGLVRGCFYGSVVFFTGLRTTDLCRIRALGKRSNTNRTGVMVKQALQRERRQRISMFLVDSMTM